MWKVLFDPYHSVDEAFAPEEIRWHEGKNQNRNPYDQNASSGSGARPRAAGVKACFVG
jgi:hypothetical protein